jgi:GntR family transcriptional regulator / MocR family aminotransferase
MRDAAHAHRLRQACGETQIAPPRTVRLEGWDVSRPAETLHPSEIATRLAGLARGVPMGDLERVLRAAILDQTLPAGARLPSPELLAKSTGMSQPRWRKVLALAIEEGLLEGPVDAARVRVVGQDWARTMIDNDPRIDSDLRTASGLALAPGEAPWDVFPIGAWSRLHERVAMQLGTGALRAGHPAGWAPLRRVLAGRLSPLLGREVSWPQILILPSRRAALRLVVGTLLDIGGQVWTESPGDPAHRAAVLAANGRAVGLPIDQAGLHVPLGRDVAPSARLAIASLGASIPIGARLTNARRAALDAWAGEVGGWFIEDDLGGNLLLDPAIDAAGPHTRRVLVGSLGKLAAPGVDLAYIVAPAALADRLFAELVLAGHETSTLHQAAMHAFLTTGAFDLHMQRLRMEAEARFEAFWNGISRHLGSTRALRADALAFTATIDLATPAAEQAMLARCRAAGFGAMGLSGFADPAMPSSGLVIGFGGCNAARLEIEATRLGLLLRAQQAEERARSSSRFFT